MPESLAVRHRPRRFADVGGQRHVSAVLRSAAARQAPPQQILLAGGSGLGKTTLARIFAAALFCSDRAADGDACGVCDSCRDITGPGGFHPDVIELDAASHGGKDEVRDIAERAALSPLRAAWKIYIIDEAHGLTGAGGQAFLKLLEEPPSHTLFVLATTDPEKLPTAVRGRCSILEVLAPTPEEIAANLRRVAAGEGWDLTDDVVAAVQAATDPALGMRGTVMTLEKLTGPLSSGQPVTAELLQTLLGTVTPQRLCQLTEAIVAGDRGAALTELAALSAGAGATQLRRQLTEWARTQLLAACHAGRGEESAYHRYEVLVAAGRHPGALEVAVAQMANPQLSESVQAVRALLEQAQETLAQLAGATHGSPAAPPPAAVAARAADTPVAPATSAPATAPTPPTPSPAPPAAGADAVVTAALNTVGRVSARAALVLRRCTWTPHDDGTLEVCVPEELAGQADDVGLPALLVSLAGEGKLPGLTVRP